MILCYTWRHCEPVAITFINQDRLTRATALEKEKKDIEIVLERRVLEFENEKTSLQSHIQSMGEDLLAKAEAQEKVNQLQVHQRFH